MLAVSVAATLLVVSGLSGLSRVSRRYLCGGVSAYAAGERTFLSQPTYTNKLTFPRRIVRMYRHR